MDEHRLKCFVAVYEQGSVSAAATRLHMTQPPLSMLLRKLEGELGVGLFDRSGHRLAPTATGELFYLRAKAVELRLSSDGPCRARCDADGVRLDHIAEMYRLKGGGNIHGDMQPRPASRLAILPNTTHVTLMERMTTIVPLINDFLVAQP